MIQFFVPFVFGTSRFLFRLMLRLYTTIEVVGKENVPRRGGLIVASNHLNNADPGIIAACLGRRVVFMAKAEMFEWLVWGMYIRLLGAFPVRRGEADVGAMKRATEVVSQGQVLLMFPEGTRSRSGALAKARAGTALVALRSGVPILPVALTGTEAVKLPVAFLKFSPPFPRLRFRMVIGKPFFLPPAGNAGHDASERHTDIIMGKIAELLPPEYRGVYADKVEAAKEAVPAPAGSGAERGRGGDN